MKSYNDSGRLASIDIELESLCERVALLKAERNALIPISGLPSEILVHIFGIFADEYSAVGVSSCSKLKTLLLVCRHWHELALAFPTLWSTILFVWAPSVRRLMAQLDRSGAAPLTIRIGCLHPPDYVDFILPHAARIELLDIGGVIGDASDLMRRMSGHKFTLLHSLSITPRENEPDDDPELHPNLPSELLDGMPQLRVLELAYIDAPWQSLARLHSLSLKGRPNSPAPQLPFSALLAVLASSPELHTLKLFASTLREEPAEQQCQFVELPLLRHLHVRDTLTRCEDLLAHLFFPVTTRVELYPLGIHTGADIRNILVPVRKHLRAAGAPIPKLLTLSGSPVDDTGGHFLAAVYLDPNRPASLGDNALFAINAHPNSVPALRQIMIKVLKMIPTHEITHLDACGTHFTPKTWKTVFELLPALRVVSLEVDDAGIVFCESGLEAGAAVSLRGICIHSFIRPGGDASESIITPFFDALTRLLSAYHTRGTPMARLHIKDYIQTLDLGEATFTELGGLVGELVRDGRGYW
ncbi:hypothetical protein B0H11DRAFT_1979663 [Mycena galericulata]|nr:hypothetical protein B0H11DRAFT_1979663 [Mycena galericulata]